MKGECKLFNGSDAEWDELVKSSLQGNAFLLAEFQNEWCESDQSLHVLRIGYFDKLGKLIAGQSIFHKSVFGFRLPNTLNIFYASTPILSQKVQKDSRMQFDVLSEFARVSRRLFPYLEIEFHPSLEDVRPYLEQGWLAHPEYTYTWNIRDPNAILMGMNRKRSYVRKALEQFVFASETSDEVLSDFLRLYGETVEKFGWRPDAGWGKILRTRINWMQSGDLVRLFTCRTKSGKLVGMVTYILSRANQTAYFHLIGYDHVLNSKEFPPAIHWYAAKELSEDFATVDFGEGYGVNIYAFKDSLGASSAPFWKLKTPNASYWMKTYDTLAKLKSSIKNHLRFDN